MPQATTTYDDWPKHARVSKQLDQDKKKGGAYIKFFPYLQTHTYNINSS
jgi:hypothetical protein